MWYRRLKSIILSFGKHHAKSKSLTEEMLDYTNTDLPIFGMDDIRPPLYKYKMFNDSISILISIDLKTERTVYMYGNENESYSLVWISSKRLMEIWHPSQRDDYLRTRQKMHGAAACFEQCEEWPVLLANVSIGEFDIGKRSLKFNDGITRTSWLIEQGVKSIPLLCTHDSVDEFRMLAAMS